MKKKRYACFLTCLLLALFGTGCTREIDYVVGPINSKLAELGDTVEKIDVPAEVVPDAKFRFKSRKLIIEKRF